MDNGSLTERLRNYRSSRRTEDVYTLMMSNADDIREKLTDNEYKELVENIAKAKDLNNNFYKCKIARIIPNLKFNGALEVCFEMSEQILQLSDDRYEQVRNDIYTDGACYIDMMAIRPLFEMRGVESHVKIEISPIALIVSAHPV